jgi:hexosaminidase
MSWRGTDGGIAAARAGHDVVMAPNSHTYFDHYQSKDPGEPLAIGGFTPLEKVYSFEPIPEQLTPEEARRVLGAQAQLWTEYIPTPEHAEYMAYPRLCALAEVVWSPRASRDFAGFLARMRIHEQRLKFRGVNSRPLDRP